MTRHWTRPTATESARMIEQAREWAGEEAEPDQIDEAVEYGAWTLDDMRRAAAVAVSRTRISEAAAREVDLRAAAFSGVGLAVAENPDADWSDVVNAGQRELWNLATRNHEESGRDGYGHGRPSFDTYWLDEPDRFPPPTRIDARLTLTSVLADLDDRDRSVLLAWAITEDFGRAAEVLGCHRETCIRWLSAARRAALALWFDDEVPPPLTRLPLHRRQKKTECVNGHELLGDNVGHNRQKGRYRVVCLQCKRDKYRAKKEAATA